MNSPPSYRMEHLKYYLMHAVVVLVTVLIFFASGVEGNAMSDHTSSDPSSEESSSAVFRTSHGLGAKVATYLSKPLSITTYGTQEGVDGRSHVIVFNSFRRNKTDMYISEQMNPRTDNRISKRHTIRLAANAESDRSEDEEDALLTALLSSSEMEVDEVYLSPQVPLETREQVRHRNSSQDSIMVVSGEHAHIPLIIEGSGYTVIRFDGKKGNSIHVVAQFRDRRFDPTVPVSNCAHMYFSVGLHSQRERASSSPSTQEESEESSTTPPPRQPEEEEGAWVAFWRSITQLFDTSVFCEVLASVGLRVDRVRRNEPYYVVIRSSVSYQYDNYDDKDPAPSKNFVCAMNVFIDQTSAASQWTMQVAFALVLPLILLIAPLPLFLRRADLIQTYLADVDLSTWMWFPPYFLRNCITHALGTVYTVIHTMIIARKEEERQRRLAKRQRELREAMEENMLLTQQGGVGLATQKNLESPPVESKGDNNGAEALANPPLSLPLTQTLFPSGENATDSQAPGKGEALGEGNVSPHTAPHVTHDGSYVIFSQEAPLSTKSEPVHAREPCAENDSSPPDVSVAIKPGSDRTASHTILFSGVSDAEADEERFCRICREGDEEEALVEPCTCTGSVRFVHRNCLDHWRLECAKRNMRNVNTCEICKKPFTIGIRRSTLFWESSRHIIGGILLFCTTFVTIVAASMFSFSVIGGASCFATYHKVAYSNTFAFEGLLFSGIIYFTLTLIVVIANMIVYSWFRSRPDVEEYVNEMGIIPVFWTRGNVALVFLVSFILIAQIISCGYLVKLFMYMTSTIVWNWEISPLVGAALVLPGFFMLVGAGDRVLTRWNTHHNRRARAEDVVIIVPEAPNPNPPGDTAPLNAGSRVPHHSAHSAPLPSALAPSSQPPQVTEQRVVAAQPLYESDFVTPPEQRVIRAVEYCPPQRNLKTL